MNGNKSGQAEQNAREMTAEIDRITEAEVARLEAQNQLHRDGEHANNRSLNREQAGSLGSQILTYNPSRESIASTPSTNGQVLTYNPDRSSPIQQENEVIRSDERVLRQAEREEGYLEAAEHDTSINGAETAIQAQQWLADDREDIANESGLNGRYVKNLMDRNNKRITKETVNAVDKMIEDRNYHPSQLDRVATKARVEFLKDVFNRILGSRN